MKPVVCSESMEEYFSSLQREVDLAYDVARRARKKGFDPELDVEIPQASDLAARVEKLLYEWDVEGVASRIRELSEDHNREEVSLLIAKEYSKLSAKSREFAIERAVRLGLAVLTEGILVAPLEGITGVSVDRNNDGSNYLTVYFSGPIRSAGGTGQAMSVLIADVVRREMGLGRYVPTGDEVDRLKEEIPLYKSCQHLQYTPSNDEIDLIARNVPVCINGEATEETKVSGFRNLPRVKTEFVRGGACLVIAEGLCLKAPKIQKHVKRLGIDGWEFIDKFLNLKKKGVEDSGAEIAPNAKYLKDMLVGRPVLAHPSRVGGFRLRYGRTRATGLAALAMNPATMSLLGEFIAIGTQLKIERPGKAGAITPCDSIEGPIALLTNGDLVQVNTMSEARAIKDKLAEIVDVGEVLIPYGEFAENNHLLMPAGYSIEWHREELLDKLGKLPDGWQDPEFSRAVQMSRDEGVPLHPKFNLFWSDLQIASILKLREHVLSTGAVKEDLLSIKNDDVIKRLLEDLGALHRVDGEWLVLDRYAEPFLLALGIVKHGESLDARIEVPASEKTSLGLVSALSGIEMRARAMTRIGARVARPEKARERRMKPPPHGLFPVGTSGGAQRIVNLAAEQGSIKVELGERQCPKCGSRTFLTMCQCGTHTLPTGNADTQEVPINTLLESALEGLKERRAPEIKGVQGMISRNKTPEVIEKAILRAKNGIFVFKDGTVRIDATDVPLTHFTPEEVGIDVQAARRLGYAKDSAGRDLESPNQMLELKVQDVIIPDSCVSYLVQTSRFIDDLLVKFYGGEAFYKIDRREDLVGHLVVGLAPHTSGGVLARVVGFTPAHAGYAHPFFHAAKRRNCDGDEDSIILLMDCLLNFSRAFLPEKRGGLMDAPLVLTTKLDPNEIDKEAHNMDVGSKYPLEFYRATQRYAHPKEVESMMDLVSGRIGTVLQYEGMSFTHDLKDISDGPTISAYTSLETMDDKLRAQISLGVKIRAVDEADLVHRIITRHLIPDIQGSLKSFTGQQLRCSKCGAKYRRIPLMGKCYCGHKLTLTVHEAGVSKYLERAKEIGEAFNVPQYTQQRISLLENSIRSLFQSDKVKNPKLDEFF
ncbi:MAG: DNA polymerase II large subunit [Euryarchaeota archaeon RBG_19FT_COMBO_56_21]|nr:MAG: DNA polymerase II large subunit [Euryarchaeota archaeon RBG_19FT_COMBO_56_21]